MRLGNEIISIKEKETNKYELLDSYLQLYRVKIGTPIAGSKLSIFKLQQPCILWQPTIVISLVYSYWNTLSSTQYRIIR